MNFLPYSDNSSDPDEVRAADARIVQLVRQMGRESHEFRYLREALFTSGLGGLVRMGPWRALVEARRRKLAVPKPVPPSFREEYPTLCFFAVQTSIDGFMQRQVIDGGWRSDGGASLRGYYRTSALYALVSQYRVYHEQETIRHMSLDQQRLDGADPESDGCQGALVRAYEDPEQVATLGDLIRHEVSGVDERVRAILAFSDEGYTQKEIADKLGMSEEAVSSALRRFRRRRGGDASA